MSEIKVILGTYKGVTVPKAEVTVSEGEIAAELERARSYAATSIDKDGGVAEMGDQAIIDFVGYINDEAFEGGDGKDYPLVLGSNTFIPGFEEQLVGAKVGDEVDVKVPFPENYHAPEYAGKDAIFKVTIKSLRATITPELSDEVVAKISPCKTVEEFKGFVEQQIRDFKTKQLTEQKENNALTAVVEGSQIEIPESEIEERAAVLKNNLVAQLRNTGNTLEAYLDYNNSTEEMLDGIMKTNAENMLKGQAVLLQIAKEEGFSYTQEQLDQEVAKTAMTYQMPEDEFRGMIGENGVQMIGEDLLHKMALDFITNEAVEA